MTDLAALDERWEMLETAVDATPGIDPWCSGPDWVVPASRAFGIDSEPLIIGEPGAIIAGPGATDAVTRPGLALLARYRGDDGRTTIAGLEPLWGFASPILTTDPEALGQRLASELEHVPEWEQLVIPGLHPDGVLARAVGRQMLGLGQVGLAAGITRQVADLGDGFEPWLDRRRPRFRRNIRQAERRAAAAGVAFADVAGDAEMFDRLLAIEARTWKGTSGMLSPTMSTFYRDMTGRLRDRNRLRATVATRRGRDIGFIVGGLRNNRYRGLQLSFTEDARELSVGHLLQWHEVRALARDDIEIYDLGMDIPYKRRWADRPEESVMLVVRRP